MGFFHRVDNLVISRRIGADLVTSSTSALAFDCPLESHQIVATSTVTKAWEAKEQHLAPLLEAVGQQLSLQIGCYKLNYEAIVCNMPNLLIILAAAHVSVTICGINFYHIIASNLIGTLLDSYVSMVHSKGGDS